MIGLGLGDIMTMFNKFNDFSMAVGQTDNKVRNGFVSKIDYQNAEGTTFSAALKSMPEKDNMTIEYLVGHFGVNKFIDKFPCFTYTCNLYYFMDNRTYTTLSHHRMDATDISAMVTKYRYLREACTNFGHECLLTQFIQGRELRKFYEDGHFVDNELLKVLFIIYQALNELRDNFTHYDLHPDNVLLFKLPNDEVFEYDYGGDCTFKSPYLPKIIDYGRSFIKPLKTVRDTLCSIVQCRRRGQPAEFRNHLGESTCELSKGLSWLAGPMSEDDEAKRYHINSTKPNRSHDLRLLKSLLIYNKGRNFINQNSRDHIKVFFRKVKFPLTRIQGSDQEMAYAVKENTTQVSGSIVNVMDAYSDLLRLVKTHYSSQPYPGHRVHSSQQYPGQRVHRVVIRTGQPMQYTPP
jgi:hypothetical protein